MSIFSINDNNNDFLCANILEYWAQWRNKTKALSNLLIVEQCVSRQRMDEGSKKIGRIGSIKAIGFRRRLCSPKSAERDRRGFGERVVVDGSNIRQPAIRKPSSQMTKTTFIHNMSSTRALELSLYDWDCSKADHIHRSWLNVPRRSDFSGISSRNKRIIMRSIIYIKYTQTRMSHINTIRLIQRKGLWHPPHPAVFCKIAHGRHCHRLWREADPSTSTNWLRTIPKNTPQLCWLYVSSLQISLQKLHGVNVDRSTKRSDRRLRFGPHIVLTLISLATSTSFIRW